MKTTTKATLSRCCFLPVQQVLCKGQISFDHDGGTTHCDSYQGERRQHSLTRHYNTLLTKPLCPAFGTQDSPANVSVVSLPPPPPTAAQSKWKYHTFGGKCIYCGSKSVTPSHLQQCVKYREALAEEMAEYEEGYNIVGGGSPPGAYFGTGSITNTKTTGNQKEATPPPNNINLPTKHPLGVKVTPLDTKTPTQKKARTTIATAPQGLDYSCLVCGELRCPYDTGFTVLVDEPSNEFDPCGDVLKNACLENTDALLLPFREVNLPIRMVVAGLVQSKGIWSAHKYIGNPRLDPKLKTWMRNRLVDGTIVDTPNWAALRHSVKETFRYKRQRSVELIRTVFMSKCFGCFATSPAFPNLKLFLLGTNRTGRGKIQRYLSSSLAPIWIQF
jgi:hypothetical protein